MTATETQARREPGPCPLCGGARSTHEVTGYDRFLARPGQFDYARCAECGLLHMDPLPDPDAIPGFYPDDYDPYSGVSRRRRDTWINRMATRYYYGTDSVNRSGAMRALFRLLSGRVMKDIRPPRGQNRLLDVGCAAGNLLVRYRELGWSVAGVEMSEQACEVARSRDIEVHHGTIYDSPYEPGSFDMIVLSHVIEHVLEPERFLARCADHLAPGGLLVLATPNASALGLGLFRSCWFPLDAPRHLMLFDPKTIRRLGEKAGLSPTRVFTPAEPRMYAESRHYVVTQGQELPAELDERARVIETSIERKEEHRGYRRLIQPLAAVGSWFGRGEILEAEFVKG